MLRNLLVLMLLAALIPLAAAERGFVPKRRAAADYVALVIGNGTYPDMPLANPVNDAADVGKAFESIGFQVQMVTDSDKAQMLRAIQAFGERLPKAKAAVFYYAGHGVQVNGSNWLLPVARQAGEIINREDEVRLRAVDANEVLVAMERAKVPVAMIVLDACRNNPFKSAGRSGVKGLAQLDAPPGSLIVYATSPGQVASDGNGRNSPFTQAFLAQLLVPGQDVDAMLRNVRKAVQKSTGGVQVPWSASSMTESFTFVPSTNPDEEAAIKRAELANLQGQDIAATKAEASAATKRQTEEAALAAKQAEVDKLNTQVEELRKKLNGNGSAPSTKTDDDLDRMVAMVRQKEEQEKELKAMREKVETARRARESEIDKMKKDQAEMPKIRQREEKRQFEKDLAKYHTIACSEYGREISQAAWDKVLVKWGLTAGSIPRGKELALAIKLAPQIGTVDRPRWASGFGWDQYGTWAELKTAQITQRFRLIHPGTFTMGAPSTDEMTRFLETSAPHQVTLTRAYWMADSACTQELWQAVMETNPSLSPLYPVDKVGWKDCQKFITKLNKLVDGGTNAIALRIRQVIHANSQ